MSRNWIKLYVDQSLRGTMMSELPAAGRWIFIGLLLMAGDSNVEGTVFLRKSETGSLIGYSDATLSELLAVDLETYQSTKEKLIKFDKITTSESGVIFIKNWDKYQSEYGRKRKYGKKPDFGADKSHALDLDLDLDREQETKKTPLTPQIDKNDDEIKLNFDHFYKAYPKKVRPKDSEDAFRALIRKGVTFDEIAAAVNGYNAALRYEMEERGRDLKEHWSFILNPATFLRKDRWKEYIGIKYKTKL